MMRVHNPRGRGSGVEPAGKARCPLSSARFSTASSTHQTKMARGRAEDEPRTLGPPLWDTGVRTKIGPQWFGEGLQRRGLTSILFLHSSPTPYNRSVPQKTSVIITNMSQKHIPTPSPIYTHTCTQHTHTHRGEQKLKHFVHNLTGRGHTGFAFQPAKHKYIF